MRCYEVTRAVDGTEIYLALELIAKQQGRQDASLRSWLTPGQPLPLETALLFALQVTRGMQHATERISGFVHRDLKPENLLVGADRLTDTAVNRLRVTDFGLAAVLECDSHCNSEAGTAKAEYGMRNTQLTEGIAGTPLYMAPEQWHGETVGAYTDIYALGCILYEMLNGQPAAAGRSVEALQHAHCTGKLRTVPALLPKGLRTLIARCLEFTPGKRYRSWENVEIALTTALESITGSPAPIMPTVATLNREGQVAAGWSYSDIGRGYLDIGKANVALDYFERAAEIGHTASDYLLEAVCLMHLGLAHMELGDARQAIGFYEQGLTIMQKVGDRRVRGMILGNLGNAYLQLGDARRAIRYSEQCLTIHREIGDQYGEGVAYVNLGNAYFALGDAKRAVGLLEQALVIRRETGDRRGEGNILGNLGTAFLQLGDVQRAFGYLEQCLTIHREIGDRSAEGNVLGNLGNAYLQMGDARRAIGYFEQCLTIHREVGDRHAEAADMNNLGSAYRNLGDARRAISCFEQGLKTNREIDDRHGEGTTLGNLGNAYLGLGDVQRAVDYYERALGIHREIAARREEGTLLGNLGIAYKELGDMRRAISCFDQSLEIDREIGNRQGEALACWNLGLLYEEQDNLARAAELMQICVDFEREIGHPDAEKDAAYVARLRSGQSSGGVPSPTQVLEHFAPVIEMVVAAADGPPQFRAAVKQLLLQMQRNGWQIAEPVRRIWAGERDGAKLTAGLDLADSLIVREILRQLKK